jgi:thiol-disulfide isomerase/thioredoxin
MTMMASYFKFCLLLLAVASELQSVQSFAGISVGDRSHGARISTSQTQLSLFGRKSKAFEVQSHADWLELLDTDGDDDDDRITLVLFKAKFCKTCQAFEREWKRKVLPLASASDDRLQLGTVDVQQNRKLIKEVGVKSLPTVQFYFRGNLLTSFTCVPKEFHRVESAVEFYLNTASPHELEFETNMERKKESLDDALTSIEDKRTVIVREKVN